MKLVWWYFNPTTEYTQTMSEETKPTTEQPAPQPEPSPEPDSDRDTK